MGILSDDLFSDHFQSISNQFCIERMYSLTTTTPLITTQIPSEHTKLHQNKWPEPVSSFRIWTIKLYFWRTSIGNYQWSLKSGIFIYSIEASMGLQDHIFRF